MNDTLKVAGRIGAELGAAKAENDRLREALRWYEEKVAECRKIGSLGDNARQALDRDGGFRARDALSKQADHVRDAAQMMVPSKILKAIAWGERGDAAEAIGSLRCLLADPEGEDEIAFPDSPEPTDTYTAVDMDTAAAQGFRDGQAAVEQAPAQDEREAPIVVATAILGGLFHGGSGPELGEIDIEVCTPALETIQCETVNSSDDVFLPLMTVAQHERIVAALARPAQTEQQPVAINPDPPELMIRWHESPESVHRAMWESVAIREGMTYDELLAEGVTCGFDESGNEVEMEAGADIEGMRMQGCWAFVDTLNSCIHAWAAPDTDRGLVLHMLAHEIGHVTGTPHPDGFQEEMRAEQFGRVAALAYDMLLNKDRPECAAPECGCADAFCMAWPDD